MSTQAAPRPAARPAASSAAPFHLDLAEAQPTPFGRLVRVELRKALDTRAGRWFAAAILAVVAVTVVVSALTLPEPQQTFQTLLGFAGGGLGYFLPVLVVLLVTSEWSQRTGLATFTLEPRRGRVVAAKLVASGLLVVAALALSALLAAGGTLLSTVDGGSAVWSLQWSALQAFVLGAVLSALIGFTLGLLLRSSPAAIVGYFAYTLILPGVVAALSALVGWVGDVAPWVEFNTAQMPLFTGDGAPTGQQWAQIAVSGTVWLVVPFVAAMLSVRRAEVK